MTKKILILGCSHVSGHGFEDNVAGFHHSKYAWPSIIKQVFDVEIIDYSASGQSPIYCVEKLQQYSDKELLSAIMIILPYRMRTLMSRTLPNGVVEDVPYNLQGIDDSRWESVLENYQLTCHNWRVHDIDFLAYYGYFHWVSSKYNIPLWINCSTKDDYSFLKDNKLELSMPMDWYTWCEENKFPRLPDNHFGHEAHEQLYLKYIKPWLQEKVFPQ
jgi:hypothetical protein